MADNTNTNSDKPEGEITEVTKERTNFKPIGRSGTLVTGGIIQSDYLTPLIGVEGQEQYSKMLLSDSQVRKNYHAVSNPIKSAEWDVEAAGDDPKSLEQAALIRHILFEGLPDGFVAKLDEILSFPWHGHAVFEVIHENKTHKELGPYTGLKNLAFRDQRTLDKWNFSPEGILETIHQIQSGTVEVNVDLPAENLLIFYNEKKGNDSGFPFCRMIYGNYKRKLLYKELQAIGIERAALPVPHLKLPETVDYDSPEYADAVQQLGAFTQAEQAFFVTPAGYDLVYNQTGTFDPAKVQVAIKAENEEISGALVAMWLEMGIGGNSAVGSSTGIAADFFRDGIEYLADKIADTINRGLIEPLMRLNFGDDFEKAPKLTHAGIADEAGKELMEVVTGYTAAGVVSIDEPLEDHIRKAHNLPPKAEGEMLDNKESQDDDDTTPPDDDNIIDDNADDKDGELDPPKEEVQLSAKGVPKTPKALITSKATVVATSIREALTSASGKYVNDVMKKYKQLPEAKQQNATNDTKIGFQATLKKDLKRILTATTVDAIDMARTEIPAASDVQLNTSEKDMLRMTEKYGDISEIKLNDFSKLPPHIQVLIAKQAGLITDDSLTELKKRLDFSFSGILLKTGDEAVIQQKLEDESDKFIKSGQIDVKGTNASSTMVNEGRESFFFEPEVLDTIHSFTFVNHDPKSAICKELAGSTYNTNDAESLRYTPPLHHNCKSYIRANLKSSKGTSQLEVTSLAPSAAAKKSITL